MFAINWIGTLPGWLTLAAIVGVTLAVRGGQIGPAISYLREANATLETQVTELKKQLAEEQKENAVLKASRDLAPMQTAILDTLAQHEGRAAERFEKTVGVLGQIADMLGPERDG